MNTEKIEYKITLWTQMQTMVISIEERNHRMLGFGTVVPAVVALMAAVIGHEGYFNQELINCICIIMPLILLFATFSGAFNNKYSALIRGYLAGLEESINADLKEEVFIWNKGYSELFHKRFFPTNDIICWLYSIVTVTISILCFYDLFFYFNRLITIIYALVYICFSAVFLFDLLTNGKTKKYAKIYFYLYNIRNKEKYKEFDTKSVDLIKTLLFK